MEITFCGVPENDADQLRQYLGRLKELGATSVQTYIYWNKVESAPGVFDWSHYDRIVDLFGAYGLKWVPFLIAGPWYVTPEWVRQEPETIFCRCLEHDRDSKIVSIHSPNMPGHVRRLLKACADRYLDRGVLESVLLGITGDYGEAIYSVLGNWPGKYHGHLGYWCGEEPARAAFRRYLENIYGGIDRLNRCWGTNFGALAEIQPTPRDASPSARAWLDQVAWYRREMTDYARIWLETAKDCFPEVEIYLCTGGDGTPQHGADFSVQCKLAAACGAGIRITNEGSDYSTNFLITRLVAAASKHYGCFFGYEPASFVDYRGVAARIFNAAASGARQLFEYAGNLLDGGRPRPEPWTQFLRHRHLLQDNIPEIEVAVLMPLEDFALREVGTTGYFRSFAKKLRGFVDYDLIDAGMIEDGALQSYRFLFVVGAEHLARETVGILRAWVEQGGVLITNAFVTDWDGSGQAWRELLGFTPDTDRVCAVNRLCLANTALTPRLQAGPELLGLEGYTGLAQTVLPLAEMRDLPAARALWVNRFGRGAVYVSTIKVDFDPEESDSYAWFTAGAHFWAFIRDALAKAHTLVPPAAPPATLEDGSGVYATAFGDRLMCLNFTPEPAVRNGETIPEYGIASFER
ncbi:MAG: beta-galactosidase [Bacteroidota bacterium]